MPPVPLLPQEIVVEGAAEAVKTATEAGNSLVGADVGGRKERK
ncbi:MAG TPA: hypothetical protein VM389_12105 [Phycisphaerae bacterium]|nr:hypothetical protein [Phycisphaerae bacterium]